MGDDDAESLKMTRGLRPAILLTLAIGIVAACTSVPRNENPNRIRSMQRLAYEACMDKYYGDERQCKTERHNLLWQQEWEMMSSDS
jgi:hypothetical protein